jgi:peptidoglycan/LPS O-acetylase OafA/YrhL
MCLAIGTSIYRNFTGEASNRSLLVLLGFVALSVPVETYFNYVMIKKDDILEHYNLLAVLAPWSAAYLVFVGAYLLRACRFPRVFVWLGLISYSVYLLHPSLQALIPALANPLYHITAMVGIPVAVSVLTYRFVEQPGIALGTRISNYFPATRSRSPTEVLRDPPASREGVSFAESGSISPRPAVALSERTELAGN